MDARTILSRMQAIDRRWIFLFIAVSVIVPMAFELRVAGVPTPEVQAIYDRIEALPERSLVLLPFDFDPPSEPELLPMAIAWVRHLAARNHRMVFISLWPQGPAETQRVIERVIDAEFPDYEYGVDYVTLGFKAGNQGVIQGVVSDFRRQFGTDTTGRAVESFSIMEGVTTLADFAMILNVSSGDPGIKQWVQFGGDPTGVPVAGGVTAVSAPQLIPYYPRQMFGVLGGMQGAAAYEALLMEGFPERWGGRESHDAMKRMGPQTTAHVVIILFIIIGNVAYFATGRRGVALRSSGR